ncbi:hypothetical protein GTA08_BOTSDO03025 [Neofusicoccum parvum]|uniref:Uncharacterized protein n=1 Tax=Neofusicoccum parvum TaxID=310453 RepID=A0ACB5SAK8_9PEZI|nr:hypothetical protein GTA08_BOTSDO03025 [Neofusicoccum parvum]
MNSAPNAFLTPAPLKKNPPARPSGLSRLAALLANPRPSSSAHAIPETARIRTTVSALPSLDATRAYVSSLQTAYDKSPSSSSSSPTAQARDLHKQLSTERGEEQTLNDMAFESHELTYPELLARDAALGREEVERVRLKAEELGRADTEAYGRWEGEVFAGIYGRVSEEVGAGVEGLGVVEEVGAGAVAALVDGDGKGAGASGGAGGGSGLVKINARTGEVIVVDGLAPAGAGAGAAAPPPNPNPAPSANNQPSATKSLDAILHPLALLSEATKALLTLHSHISARHSLLAATVADRDARYARAQLAPLEFLVAFDALENPGAADKEDAEKAKDADGSDGSAADPKEKLRSLQRHFTSARLGAAARAAAEEEARARQTWQRVEAWMEAGLAAAGRWVEDVVGAVQQVVAGGQEGEDAKGLLERAEAGAGEVAAAAKALVRGFWQAEVLLNEAEFRISVAEARGQFWDKGGGGEGEDVVRKLEEERRVEDGLLREELRARVEAVEREQVERVGEVVRKVRGRLAGLDE